MLNDFSPRPERKGLDSRDGARFGSPLQRFASATVIVTLSLPFSACDRPGEPSKTFADPAPSSAEKVEEKAEETVRAAKDLALQKKREYQRRMEEQLEDFDDLLAELRSKSEEATAEGKDALNQAVKDLEAKKDVLQNRLKEFESASADAAQSIRQAMEDALKDLERSYEQAASEVE